MFSWRNEILRAKKLMKDQFWRAKQNYLGYYETLPIDDKAILLESEHGKKLDGNIFYLIRYLATDEKYKDYKIYVCSMGRHMKKFRAFLESHGIERVEIVMLASDEYLRLLASAKYLINDTSFGPYYLKKEGQVYLNTWHGTPLKTLGRRDASGYHGIGNIESNFLKSDFLLYPNEFTRDVMLRDYMLYNIARGEVLLSGYPRNEIFFDGEARQRVRDEVNPDGKRIYVYMPTYRGTVGKGKTSRSSAYLIYYLCELDKKLGEDELLYVNLHPLATDGVSFGEFKHIRRFPSDYEVYEFLNIADVLITDYSSVFFDFAVTGRKTVLFTYDEEEYLATRGMYLDIRTLPFPRVYDVEGLLAEIRSEKGYDDSEFLETYCSYECSDASAKLCDAVILGALDGVKREPIPSNGKDNVLIYAGNLANNGITASLRTLLNTVDPSERNYIISFASDNVAGNKENILTFPEGVSYLPLINDINLTLTDRVYRKLFKENRLSARAYMKRAREHVALGLYQSIGMAKIDSVIQFNGYESEMLLLLSAFKGRKSVYVHNDMLGEIKLKGNQRRDVLAYAYRTYDNVAIVTEDLRPSTLKISGRKDNIKVVKNTINYQSILERSSDDITEDSYALSNASFDTLSGALASTDCKLINIGRFAPEKGQDRLIRAFAALLREKPDCRLFIIGGYSHKNTYNELSALVTELGLDGRVILIQNMPNPYALLSKCDGFILSSHYEGFGLVLAEADILGVPVVSTDITGPRLFMQTHGGVLVESSEDGVLEGLRLLASGEVKPMGVDYAEYNREAVEQFEQLFK